jgi:mRNA interferase RelE/StbE
MERNFNGKGEKLRKKLIGHVYPQLRNNPYFGKNIKKLKNYSPDTWRYRIGGYRFFCEIDDKAHITLDDGFDGFMTGFDLAII